MMATATVRTRHQPTTSPQDLALGNQRRNHQSFSSLLYSPATPPNPASPTNSIGSTGGLIHRDEGPPDLLTLMPNSFRDSSPNQAGNQPPNNNNIPGNQPPQPNFPRPTRVGAAGMGETEIDSQGTSPAGSLRRMARDTRGSSGSINEMGLPIQEAINAASRDRPSSRDRDKWDREKNDRSNDKQDARRTPTNTSAPVTIPQRPSPYSFDSTSTLKPNNLSTTDLLTGGAPAVHTPPNHRDSPNYDGNPIREGNDHQTPPLSSNTRQHSGDTIEPPNGEHGGWVSYDTESEPAQRAEHRGPDWSQPTNQAYPPSNFSGDRFPLTEEPDGRDENDDFPLVGRNIPPQPRNQPAPAPPTSQQPRRRDLPIPNQTTQATIPLHNRDHAPPPVIPVPKTHHSQVVQSQQWIRRPSSPLAREPVVQAQNTSSEESDTYTPRSPHATLPDIPNMPASNYHYNGNQQQPPPQQQQAAQPSSQPQQARPTLPPALVNRPRPNNAPVYEQHRGAPASMQLPMYTGASMATALSSISPSQSVSAVGSPHPQTRLPPGPPFGPQSSVFIPESQQQQRSNGKQNQMYPQIQPGRNSLLRGTNFGNSQFSLDQQVAALNAKNLSALAQLTANELRAMGFGGPQPAGPLRSPRVDQRSGPGAPRRVVEQLDKAAGEVVELQDLKRAMGMDLEQWEGRDWQNHHPAVAPVHTGQGSAQYPSSHAVLPPSDRQRNKLIDEYEHQLQQHLANAAASHGASYSSSSHMHSRPGAPIPPTPYSGNTAAGTPQMSQGGSTHASAAAQLLEQLASNQAPRALPNGEGWIPIPNTDGYPPSYSEIMSLFQQHNPGKEPTLREVIAMQLAALASEPENVEGSVFSKSETPFPPVGFNPFIQPNHNAESTRSSPRDPPGEFDKMLRRVGHFHQAPRRNVGSSIFGGDGETEVSRMAPSTATEGAGDEDEGETTEEDGHNKDGGLRLNFDNSGTDALGMVNSLVNQSHPAGIDELYPLLTGMLKSRSASVAPAPFNQPGRPIGEQWVDEVDSDEDLEVELELWGDDENAKLHPKFIRDEAKRRRKWEIKFAELVKAFHELDRLTDTPMILLAAPPQPSIKGPNAHMSQMPPVPHIALSRSIKRDSGYVRRAHEARQSYHNILMTPPTSRAESYQSASPTASPPLAGRPWSGSGSAASASATEDMMRAQMIAALGSLRLMTKVEEKREQRRREEAIRQKDEREAVERMLKGLLAGSPSSAPGSSGRAGSTGAGSVRDESVGVPAPAEENPIGTTD